MNAAILAAALVLLLMLVLRWAARHQGGSTPEGDAFMDALGRHPSRGVTPGGGR